MYMLYWFILLTNKYKKADNVSLTKNEKNIAFRIFDRQTYLCEQIFDINILQ